ncbi:DUF1453 domain-containing protein [Amycolatopsis minnesotensis]|uniref:DUF1453 domain-containing protein n=1 Tax=Amycolatopsis minnesotensis TaxID=337894 RepID=A0ABN2S0I2_9PSEU
MSGPVQIVLIIAAIGYVLLRRFTGEPAEAKRMLVLPAVLTVIGLTNLDGVTGTALLFLVVTALLSIGLGALRGASVRVYRQDGVVFMRYTWVTLVLWVLNVAVKFGATLLLGVFDKGAASALGNTTMLTIGLGMLVEGVVALAKALRGGHQVIWEKGKDGAPNRTSPLLDGLRDRIANR